MEHHPDLRDRMAYNRCDLKAECEFALELYNLDCEPKIDCLATKSGAIQMDASEAMVYCLHWHNEQPSDDGEYHSQVAYDCNGEPHWIAWDANTGRPSLQSESPYPFSAQLEPYSTHRSEQS